MNLSACFVLRIVAFACCQKRAFLIGERRRVCAQVGKIGHVKLVDANHLLGIEPTVLGRHSPPNISPVSPEAGVSPPIGHETAPHVRAPGIGSLLWTWRPIIVPVAMQPRVDYCVGIRRVSSIAWRM